MQKDGLYLALILTLLTRTRGECGIISAAYQVGHVYMYGVHVSPHLLLISLQGTDARSMHRLA